MEDTFLPIDREQENTQPKFSFRPYYYFLIAFFLILFIGYFFLFVPPRKFKIGEIITIDQGSSLRSISKDLSEEGLIRSRAVFEAFVIIYGGEKHILPGDYLFEHELLVFEIARRISKGDRNIAPIKITIPEGFDVAEIAEVAGLKLSKFNKDKFIDLAEGDQGYLFPDTYFFFNNATEVTVYEFMKQNFEKKFAKIRPLISQAGKAEKEIIVMASIIEREAKGDSDRELISGILWNRLSKGMPLQVDAAPITYKEKGLPHMPIANPGLESIQAAIYPKSSSFLFYLHDKEGVVHYAKTFEEHRQNKFKYLR